MLSEQETIRLDDNDIQLIKDGIKKKYSDKGIVNPIIKDNVFKILESESYVFYYPIEDEVCAFYMKMYNDSNEEYKIVFINTNIPYDKQIFAVAHELAHIWGVAEDKQEILKNSTTDDYAGFLSASGSKEKHELIANRFAAEFLVREDMLKNELDKIISKDEEITLIHILKLMDTFLVPYKTIVKRLHEVGRLTEKYLFFLNLEARDPDSEIVRMQKKMSICKKNNEVTKEKKMVQFISDAVNLYENNLRTYSKLKSLLKIFDINSPKEVGLFDKKEELSFENDHDKNE